MKPHKAALYEISRDNSPDEIDLVRSRGILAHFHHQTELLYIHKGEWLVNIGGTEKTVGPGAICVSDSYDIHSYKMSDEDCDAYALIFPKNYLPEYGFLTKNKIPAANFLEDGKNADDARSLFLMLIENFQNNKLLVKSLTGAIMSIIFASLPYKEKQEGGAPYFMRDVLNFLHKNFRENISLNTLSKTFGYTPNYFSKVFNAYIKTGLNEYLNSIRIENAAALIRSGAAVSDAAFGSGFESIETFYRIFKRHYNTTPGRFAAGESAEKPPK